jgi:succinate dehydrogenase / fumarate reductase membrane anchor subunit
MQKDIKHWTITRLTSLPLALLFFYFLAQKEYLTTRVRMEFISWLQAPVATGAALIFIICAFWHARLGMEEIIIDYVPSKNTQTLSLWINKIIFFVLGVACLYAVCEISFRKI